MEYRELGSTGIQVSTVCLGCWALSTNDFFWEGQTRDNSIAAINAALEAGINFFDTAPMYGDGNSEELLGEALQARRHDVVIATKISPGDLAPERVRASCELSLRRLQTDYVDLLQVHWPDPNQPLDPTLDALEDLRRQGKTRAIGVSNFGVSYLRDLADRGTVITNQLPYSLLWRAIEFETVPFCQAHDIGILCYSPLCQGLLTGKFQSADDVPEKRARTRLFSASRPLSRHPDPGCEAELAAALAQLRRIAAEANQDMGQLSLAWLLHQGGVVAAICGARNAAQAAANAQAAELAVDDSILADLAAATEPIKQLVGSNADMWEVPSRLDRN